MQTLKINPAHHKSISITPDPLNLYYRLVDHMHGGPYILKCKVWGVQIFRNIWTRGTNKEGGGSKFIIPLLTYMYMYQYEYVS